MDVSIRGREAERMEAEREAAAAQEKKKTAMLEYIAAMDYPEILPDDEEEEEKNE